jgi:hypothetical protein
MSTELADLVEAYLAGWQGCREHEGLAAIDEAIELFYSEVGAE